MSYEVDYNSWLERQKERLTFKYNKIKAERDTLIDDIAVLKANNERYRKRAENAMDYAERSQCEVLRLERENEKLRSLNDIKDNAFKGADRIIKNQKHENKALRIQSNTYFDEWQESEKQRNEFISYVNLYTTLTNHIRLKAENNPGVSRYIDLVGYINRLEQK
ncbi:MAG: hypothetical protein L0L63_01130 [Staphylococcus equorum]|uniref:hypothetical protein n=1 Tax=Staphylococcus sp. IPLA37012 TaxID=3417202 RepID=UPI00264DE8B8|nr:hypothetical protein [Staphylococcus equorum]MDN6612716.1 hypothetical protein [Staphylococcus equorum]MDN6741018.1 hypothetical protein [Staphylococcus equorum]